MLQHLVNTSQQLVCLICNYIIEGSEELLRHCTQHDEMENILSQTSKNKDGCTSNLQKTSKRYVKCNLLIAIILFFYFKILPILIIITSFSP